MIERLEQRFIQSAERPALNIAGTSLSYRQLHAHSRAIQQRLQPLLDQHHGTVGDRDLPAKMQRVVCGDSGDSGQRRGVPAAGAEPSAATSAVHSGKRRGSVVAA